MRHTNIVLSLTLAFACAAPTAAAVPAILGAAHGDVAECTRGEIDVEGCDTDHINECIPDFVRCSGEDLPCTPENPCW